MPQCYRVEKFKIDGRIVSVEASCQLRSTNLPVVVETSLPGTQCAITSDPLVFFSAETLTVKGRFPAEELSQLMIRLTKAISVCDECDLSECLSFYRLPEQEDQSPAQWPHTEIGELVYRAKYRGVARAGTRLGELISDHVARHPGLRRAQAVLSVPQSSTSGRVDWPARWSAEVATMLGVPVCRLRRTRSVQPQKDLKTDEERHKNQAGSMAAANLPERVLVLDDLYMTGRTMLEAVRALRRGGASVVMGLSAAKTLKGARGVMGMFS